MTTIHPTAIIDSKAELAADVEIGPYCVVGPNVKIGPATRLLSHVILDGHTTLGQGCAIFPFAAIGTQTQDLKFKGGLTFVQIGDHTTLREYVTVNSGTNEGDVTQVGARCHVMAYCHVAHQCVVGNDVIMSNGATLAGHVLVEDCAVIGGLCGVHQFVRIGTMSILGGCSKATQDIPPFMMADGNPAGVHGLNSVGLERRNVSEESRKLLKDAYKILYRQNLTAKAAVEKMRLDLPANPEVAHLIEFVQSSQRGIAR